VTSTSGITDAILDRLEVEPSHGLSVAGGEGGALKIHNKSQVLYHIVRN
jgi:hypothetical protein